MRFKRAGAVRDERPAAVDTVGDGGIRFLDLSALTHDIEGACIPPRPVVFMKDSGTVVGPYDLVLIPRGSVKTDWEVELAVAIGRRGAPWSSPADSTKAVVGHAISNEVSERECQLEYPGQWNPGKSCETFNLLEPWPVTADEVLDPQDLALRLSVNGTPRPDGHFQEHDLRGCPHRPTSEPSP